MDDRRADTFGSPGSLDEELARAFDRLGPSKEAERRMLDALVAAERRAQKRHVGPWRLIVPLAACLAVLAGIGALAFSGAHSASFSAGSGAASDMDALTSCLDESAASPAAEGDFDVRFPFVTLSTGERLRIALGDDGPLAADLAVIETELECTVATGPDEQSSMPCTVYATSDPAHPYAVRYDGESTACLAEVIEP